MFHTNAPYLVAAALCLYAVATRGLFRATDGLRRSLIDLASEIIDDTSFPKEQKQIVLSSLDDVHSAKAAWRITFRLLKGMILYIFGSLRESTSMSNLPRALQAKCDIFVSRWVLTTVSNSVAASILFTIILITFSAFFSIQTLSHLLIKRGQKADHHAVHV